MKISVAICTYNGEKYIEEQLDSILNQKVSVDEIVVCDDLSTDKTWEILNNYKLKYPEIFKIFKNEKTLKSVKNFEKAIKLCTHEIIFLSDQDDYWYPQKTEIFVSKFKENPEMLGYCSNGYLMDENSDIMTEYFTKWDVYEKYLEDNPKNDNFNFLTQKGNFSTGATMAVRADFAKSILPVPILENFHHDEWLTLLATIPGKMGFISQKLINYRVHSSQQVGGIAFLKNSDYFSEIYQYFIFNTINDDFKSIKSRIRAQIDWHNKFLIYYKNNPLQQEQLKKKFFEELKKNKDLLKKKFPFKSFFINNLDKLLNKRQLKKN